MHLEAEKFCSPFFFLFNFIYSLAIKGTSDQRILSFYDSFYTARRRARNSWSFLLTCLLLSCHNCWVLSYFSSIIFSLQSVLNFSSALKVSFECSARGWSRSCRTSGPLASTSTPSSPSKTGSSNTASFQGFSTLLAFERNAVVTIIPNFCSKVCHLPVLDRFNQHFQATVNFPLTTPTDKPNNMANLLLWNFFLRMLGIELGQLGLESSMLTIELSCPP